MRKYILFLLMILVILGTTLVSNIIIVNNNINKTFNNSGYILKNSNESERYHFSEEATYKKSYNDQIVFNDTEGEKVVINKNNFIHYDDGSISSFTKGVLLDLNSIDTEPITYYNISANKVLKKLSNNEYVTKNLDKEIKFSNLMWRISESKFLAAGNSIIIAFADGTEKQTKGFLEIEYSDNEIVKIFNQEVSYETISTEVYLKIGENVKVNLGTKIVSKNDINEMTLENMIIDSNDNVTIIDMDEYKEEEETENEESSTATGNQSGTNISGIQGGNAGSASTGDATANGGTTIVDGSTSDKGDTENKGEAGDNNSGDKNDANNKDDNNIDVEIEEDLALYAPKFTIKEFEVSSTKVRFRLSIEDEESRLIEDPTISIIDNLTGKAISGGTTTIPVGVYEPDPIEIATLDPDKEYTLVVKSTFKVEDTEYTKNFIYKIFRTPIFGMTLSKDVFTYESLAFNINFNSDSKIEKVDIMLEDPLGNEITQTRTIENKSGKQQKAQFTGLTEDKEYIVKIANIKLQKAPMQSYKTYDYKYKTLKKIYEFENGETSTELTVQKNERDSNFILSIPISLENAGIETLNYEIYTITDSVETIIDNRIVSTNEITLKVDGEKFKRNVEYFARVYATLYDNEKTVEYLIAKTTNSFIMDTKQFPTIKFEEDNVTFEAIRGRILIQDEFGTIEDDYDVLIKCVSNFAEVITWKTKISSSVSEPSIAIDINNLRKNTTYRIEVYATLDLEDGNGLAKDCYIGTAIINTKNDAKLNAEWEENKAGDLNKVSLQLKTIKQENDENVDLAASTLTKMTINLYEGQGTENKTPFAKFDFEDHYSEEYKSEIKEEFYDKPYLVIDEKNVFLRGKMQTDVKLDNKSYYTLEITQLYDYTNNPNPDGTKGNEIEVIETTVKTIETGNAIPDNPEKAEDFLITEPITKEMLKDNSNYYKGLVDYPTKIDDIINNSNISNDTVVAIEMFAEQTVQEFKGGRITYYIYDNSERGYNQDKNQAFKAANLKIEKRITKETDGMPHALMLLTNAKDAQENDMLRGKTYYFTCEIQNAFGEVFPSNPNINSNWWADKAKVYQQIYKQQATITMYPSTSTSNTHTFKYKLTDIDEAMVSEFECHIEGEPTPRSTVDKEETSGDYRAITFDNLADITNNKLEVRIKQKLHENIPVTIRNIIQQSGYKSKKDFDNNNFSFEVDNQMNGYTHSKINIKLSSEGIDNVTDIAKVIINFKDGQNTLSTVVRNMERIIDENSGNKNGPWNIEIPYYEIIEKATTDIKDKTLNVSMDIYYDNGNTGFDIGTTNGVAFKNNEGKWLTFNGSNYTKNSEYPNIHEFNGAFPNYTINNTAIDLKQAEEYGVGINANEAIVPKEISKLTIEGGNITISNVVPTVSGVKMNAMLDIAQLEFKDFKNKDTLAINQDSLYVEIYTDKDCQSKDSTKKLTITNNISEYINDLQQNTIFYYKLFVSNSAEDIQEFNSNTCYYLYDLDKDKEGCIYNFATNESEIILNDNYFIANSYTDKSIKFSFEPKFIGDSKYKYVYNIYEGKLMDSNPTILYNNDEYKPLYTSTKIDCEIKNSVIEHIVSADPTNGNYKIKYNTDYTLEVVAIYEDPNKEIDVIKGYGKKSINIPAVTKDNLFIQMSRYKKEENGLNIKFNLSEDYKCFKPNDNNELFDVKIYYGADKDNINTELDILKSINKTSESANFDVAIFDNTIYENYYFKCTVTVNIDSDNDGNVDEIKIFENIMEPSINSGFGTINANIVNDKKIKFIFNEASPNKIQETKKIKYTLYDADNKSLCNEITEYVNISVTNENQLYYETTTTILNAKSEEVDLSEVRTILISFINENEERLLHGYRIYIQ